MKKILYGCVALSVLITALAIAQLNKKPTPVTSPDETVNLPDPIEGATAPETIGEEKTYTESEDQIQQAFENYIYFKGMDKVVHTDVRANGKDFIITITNPSDTSVAPQELRLVRTDDFAGKPQYKLNNTSLMKWQAMASEYLENPTVGADSFSEDIAWVPDLGLVTNQALKATNISIKNEGIDFSIKSIVSDMLATAENEKMNIAGSSDMSDVKLMKGGFVIQAPTVTQNIQINGANQTGNMILQLLTAQNATSTLNVPILGIAMAGMPRQPILAQLNNKIVFADNITMDTKLTNIKMTQTPLPMLPDTIISNVTVEGVSKEMLTAYVNMREQLNQSPDEDSTEAKELAQKLLAAQDQILKSVSLKINQLSFSNPNAGIDVTGIVHYAEPAPTVNARVAVTNFDVISPKAPPVDEVACKAALAKTPEPVAGQAPIVPAACVEQSGMLEALRPYLPTATRTTNEKGQLVDTFSIIYSAGSLSINNQAVLTPDQKSTEPGNNLPLGTDVVTPTAVSDEPVADTNTPAPVADTNAVAVDNASAPVADTNAVEELLAVAQSTDTTDTSLNDIQIPADNTPSVADLMAEEVDETIAVSAPMAPVAAGNEAIAGQPTDIVPVQNNNAPSNEIVLEDVDNSIIEEVADTPLEPTPNVNEIPAPVAGSVNTLVDSDAAAKAILPTAPVVDSAEIVEAQKLLDAVQ